jgi:hypothetical protein
MHNENQDTHEKFDRIALFLADGPVDSSKSELGGTRNPSANAKPLGRAAIPFRADSLQDDTPISYGGHR